MRKQVPDISEHISYHELAQRITQIPGSESIGYFYTEINPINTVVEKFHLYKITKGKGIPVLLSGSVHGYEVAGAHSILRFFKRHAEKYLDKFEFTAFPCVNPWGFDKMVHENWQYYPETKIGSKLNKDSDIKLGLNLNREWKDNSKSVEVNLIKPHLKSYEIHLDLHEVWSTYVAPNEQDSSAPSPDEFFLWENCPDKNLRFGKNIIDSVEKNGIKVCKWDTILEDINTGGVIYLPEGCLSSYAAGNFEAYTQGRHTPQSFTIETPLFEDLEYRIKANIITIETALEEILKRY
ncbi:MAG TPA: M14 family zinc carboxypeptidase [Alphaproteobacteria bacterium]|nr:M14 family zinc carboxypeptidase [Alphaproteobacteria bacterium]